MSVTASSSAPPVRDLKAFVPAKDFARSRRFYAELGFHENFSAAQIAEFQLGGYRFLLQDYYVKDWAENFMMHLMVDDADAWWAHVVKLDIVKKYSLHMAKPPAMQPWGLRVLYLSDPSGVLWHIADKPA
jgi:uncharacterized glyoxalase superfamily protein PhnB